MRPYLHAVMLAVTVALVTEQCHAGPLGDFSWSPPRSNLQFTTWSPPITNSQTGVAYRFGVTETETLLPVSWTSFPLIIEIVNTGTNAMLLYAYGGKAEGLYCKFFADGEWVGYRPVVSDLPPGNHSIFLLPQKALSLQLEGFWWLKEPGTKSVAVGFYYKTKTDPFTWDLTHDESRTAPIRIDFIDRQQKAQPKPDGDGLKPSPQPLRSPEGLS